MCTVTVLRSANAFTVTMNRDEALTRGPERPPERVDAATGWHIAPTDSDRGGTWMGANAHGVVACLLNAYRPDEDLLPDPNAKHPSRGEIIPAALANGAHDDIETWLRDSFAPDAYPSFMLFAIGPDAGYRHTWFRGEGFRHDPLDVPAHMETSSGWDSEDVQRWRRDRFERWRADGEPFAHGAPVFHFLREDGAEERSPLMLRSWSSTRSVTQAAVNADGRSLAFCYWSNPVPGAAPADACHELPLLER